MGPPKTNPSSCREEDLNPGPSAYKCSALTTRPRSPPKEREGKKSVSAIRRSKHFFPAMAEFQSNVLFKLLNLVPNGRKEEGGRWEFGRKEEKYVYLMIWSTLQLP